MDEFYNILAIYITCGIFIALGLVLAFLNIPDNPNLSNYRKARSIMVYAYLFFAFSCVVEYLFVDSGDNASLLQAITLVVAFSQALLFTFTLLALLRVEFFGWQYLFRMAIPVIFLIVLVFIVYTFCSNHCFSIAVYGFLGIYALLLVFYTRLFIAGYRQFRTKMDNYFSDLESERLRWVSFSFFSALSIGVMALLAAIVASSFTGILFSLVFNAFYIYFAIRFLNYPQQFQNIEVAIEPEPATEEAHVNMENFILIEEKLDVWIAGKGFVEPGVTLGKLSRKIYTNRFYLSSYFNTIENKSFREWINGLRIREAIALLKANPHLTATTIAEKTGFSSNSYFSTAFKKFTGKTMSEWRRN